MHEYPERRELGRGAGTWLAKQLLDRKSTRLNSSHDQMSYAVFCLKKKKQRDEVHGRCLGGLRQRSKHSCRCTADLGRGPGVVPGFGGCGSRGGAREVTRAYV